MRVIKASTADVRRAWCDQDMTLPQAAASVGMSVDTLRDRAAMLGLPSRCMGRQKVIRPHQEAEFRVMWRLGISARLIGQHFGGASYFAVVSTAARLGLPARGAGYRPPMTLDEYRDHRLAVAMKAAATADALSRRSREARP